MAIHWFPRPLCQKKYGIIFHPLFLIHSIQEWNQLCRDWIQTGSDEVSQLFPFFQSKTWFSCLQNQMLGHKVCFTACFGDKLKLACTSPRVKFLMSRIDYSSSVIWFPPKNLRTEFTNPIAKSTSPSPRHDFLFVPDVIVLFTDWLIYRCSKVRWCIWLIWRVLE